MASDPISQYLDPSKRLTRDQLELVVPKKKVSEAFMWFREHFSETNLHTYINRCPIVIFQGPAGCGKTSTLRCISQEMGIPIKVYSEVTDLTTIKLELSRQQNDHDRPQQTIQMRKAMQFEKFVFDSMIYDTLYPVDNQVEASNGFTSVQDAYDEFESDDDFDRCTSSVPPEPPKHGGVIIHVETPFSFSINIYTRTLAKLVKLIKENSSRVPRRIAIVLESLDCEGGTASIPVKTKSLLGIQVIKFNPIIKTNMKRMIDAIIKETRATPLDREIVDQVVNDADGDLRACINTVQVISNLCKLPVENINYELNRCLDFGLNNGKPPVVKKQKLSYDANHIFQRLLRDSAKNFGFFHVLGKIFYQKRLYPQNTCEVYSKPRSIDRPYQTENTTDQLVDMMDLDPENLISWLHHHYHKFCYDGNIDRAASFMDSISFVDTISLDSTQSHQFYEMRTVVQQIQAHLAIESTVYHLYDDKSSITKTSYKKGPNNTIAKPSVENTVADLYSFGKPFIMSLFRLREAYRLLLDQTIEKFAKELELWGPKDKLLIEQLPYVRRMLINQSLPANSKFVESITRLTSMSERYEDPELSYEKLTGFLDEFSERCDDH